MHMRPAGSIGDMTGDELRVRLRALRADEGISQGKAGKRIKQNQSWVSRRETPGPRTNSTDETGLTVDDARLLASAYDHDLIVDLVHKDTPRVPVERVTNPKRRALLARLAAVMDQLEDYDAGYIELVVARGEEILARRAQ